MPQRTKALKRRINRNPVASQRKGKWEQQRNSYVLWSKTKKQEVTRKFKGTKKKENYIRPLKVLNVGKCLILILIKNLIRSQRGLWSARDPLFINHGDDTPQLPSHHYSLEPARTSFTLRKEMAHEHEYQDMKITAAAVFEVTLSQMTFIRPHS